MIMYMLFMAKLSNVFWFLFLFFFWDPYNSNVGAFDIVPEVSKTILSSFHSFYFILLFISYFHHFSWHDKLYYGMNFNIAHASLWRRKWQPTPVFWPGESQGRGSLVGCHLWGRTESDTTEAT